MSMSGSGLVFYIGGLSLLVFGSPAKSLWLQVCHIFLSNHTCWHLPLSLVPHSFSKSQFNHTSVYIYRLFTRVFIHFAPPNSSTTQSLSHWFTLHSFHTLVFKISLRNSKKISSLPSPNACTERSRMCQTFVHTAEVIPAFHFTSVPFLALHIPPSLNSQSARAHRQ